MFNEHSLFFCVQASHGDWSKVGVHYLTKVVSISIAAYVFFAII